MRKATLLATLALGMQTAVAGEPVLRANLLGLRAGWPQSLLVVGAPSGVNTASLLSTSGSPKSPRLLSMPHAIVDPLSGDRLTRLDPGQLVPGEYRVRIGAWQSPVFTVTSQPYGGLQTSLLRAYYLQRCGVALDDPQTGLHHPADHREDATLLHADSINPAGTRMDVTGGWHDAGDFGKYVATTTITLGELLGAYLDAPARFPDNSLHIPESGNGQSDLLDEARFGLDWLLRMQRSDGAVYRKVSGSSWPAAGSPDSDHQPRYVYGTDSADTARFAAAMAEAARAFVVADPAIARRYLSAAQLAWQWLQDHPGPQQTDWHADDDSGSGKYLFSGTDSEASLLTDRDDRTWAAAELLLTTHEAAYREWLASADDITGAPEIAEWKDPAALGMMHVLLENPGILTTAQRERWTQSLLRRADLALARMQGSPYALANARLVWGSNKMTAAEGSLLTAAYRLSGNPQYFQAAVHQLDFLLGANPQGLIFVTGQGDHSVKHPSHLWGRQLSQDIPGLFVGGANVVAQDGIAPPDRGLYSYVDDNRAYSVNEFAIDYNAALIGLLASLENASHTGARK